MFNTPSDPWYTYMQPFRIMLLKKIIKVHQQAEQQQAEQEKAEQQQTE